MTSGAPNSAAGYRRLIRDTSGFMFDPMKRCLIVGLTVASAFVASQAKAWNDFGHMEVAAAAYKQLHVKTKQRVAELLKINPSYMNWIVGARDSDRNRVAFIRAATWADAIKSHLSGYKTSAKDDPQSGPAAAQNIGYQDMLAHSYWHYVNLPIPATGPAPATPNVSTQIPLFRDTLASASAPDSLKSYDLVWLLHLVGDVHQPLHCVARINAAEPSGDQGGNKVKVMGNAQPPVCDDAQYCPFGPPGELHAFFDVIEGSGYAVAPVEAAAAKLPKPDVAAAANLDVSAWVQEGLKLAQTKVYVTPIGDGDGPFVITPAYQAAAYTLGQERMALAGARLANLLNQALDPH